MSDVLHVHAIENDSAFCKAFIRQCVLCDTIVARKIDGMNTMFSRMRYAFRDVLVQYATLEDYTFSSVLYNTERDTSLAQYLVCSVFSFHTGMTETFNTSMLEELYRVRSDTVNSTLRELTALGLEPSERIDRMYDAIASLLEAIEAYDSMQIARQFSELLAVVQYHRMPVKMIALPIE